MNYATSHRSLRFRRVLSGVLGALLVVCALSSFEQVRSAAAGPEPNGDQNAHRGDPPSAPDSTTRPALPEALKPYRLEIVVAWPTEWSASRRETIAREARTLIARTRGEMWDFRIHEAAPLEFRDAGDLVNLSVERGAAAAAESACDQVLLVAVKMSGAKVELSGRNWNSATRGLGPVRRVETWNPREVAARFVQLAGQLFEPLLQIEAVDEERVTLRLRSGELPAVDPDTDQVHAGDLLRVHFRYLDRDRSVQQIQTVPWTYLQVEQVEREWITGKVLSGLRSPLGTNSRRRVEAIAVPVKPAFPATELQVVRRTPTEPPLAGAEVTVTPHAVGEKGEKPPEGSVHFADRRGCLWIPREAGLVWITVRSGDGAVAGVPVVAGEMASVKLPLPDDAPRLRVEGELALLEGRLVDAVAQRSATIARMRTRARDADWKGVEAAQKELGKIPGRREFESQLAAIRLPAIEAARDAGDRLTESRVRKLCTATGDLIRRYLDDDKLRQVLEEIAELRRLDAEAARDLE